MMYIYIYINFSRITNVYRFPELTLVIGKFFPERAFFQIICAIAAGVRLSLVVIWFMLTKSATSRVPMMVCIAGLLRTAALGGLVYVPVVDDHDTHDLFLTIYLMFTMAWFFGIIHLSDRQSQSRVYRKRVLRWYFVLFIPLVHYFTQHRFYQVPGALSKYSFFEYVFVALDLLFDLVGVVEFEGVEVRVYKGGPDDGLARPAKKFFV